MEHLLEDIWYLGCDDEECGLWVESAKGLVHVGAVDVGDEVNVRAALVWLESLGYHDWTLDCTADMVIVGFFQFLLSFFMAWTFKVEGDQNLYIGGK